ncbi:MAG: T9SS type A sorting domain-containing protein [Candidatus Delongbacteria bacterium]|nr:T9SS type A sorting domain-containing protein [Candidatus Delongbacteria bacterium]
MNIDPQLKDPDNLDFRLEDGSPATGYGCETYYIPEEKETKQEKIYNDQIEGDRVELHGNISRNTVIRADSVSVTGDITVEDSITLNISPGTVFNFTGPYCLDVQGTLIAEGTPDERIVFTAEKPDPVDDFTVVNGSWKGILFNNTLSTNDSSSIKYCVIEYAKKIEYDEWNITKYYGGALVISNFSKLTVENNIFRYNSANYGAAIGAVNTQAKINNNLFYENYARYNGPVACFINSYSFFYNNTAIDNYISEFNGLYVPGAIFTFRSKPYFVNNIIRNSPGGLISQIHYNKEYFTYNNNIEGIERYNGNIDRDPSFDDTQHLPGILLDNSVCEDAGAGAEFNLNHPEFDLLGNPRIVNNKVDMGAFEDQTPTSIANTPISTDLLTIYPNPANPATRITFSAQDNCTADIFIYSIKGDLLEKIEYSNARKGSNEYDLMLDKYVSGLYFVKVAMPDKTMNGKFLLLK